MTLLQCWHQVPGGTARAALDLAAALERADDVDVIGVGPAGRRTPPRPWTPSVPVRRLSLPIPVIYDAWAATGHPLVETVGRDIDVVHVTTTMVPSARRPMVVTINDLFPLTAPEQFTPRGVRLMTKGVERARREARIVVCPSEATAEDCRRHGFDEERLRVVPWGVDVERVTAEAVAANRVALGLHRPYVLAVGTIEPRKNLRTLLAAFGAAELDDHDLVLVGPQGWGEDLDAAAAPLGERVRRLGFLDAAALGATYAGADLVACPSTREGFGLPAVEAMAHGVAVVASSGTSFDEVVGDAGLLVAPLDVDSWAAALDELLDDAPRRAELARAGAERATRFSTDAVAARMTEIYVEAAG